MADGRGGYQKPRNPAPASGPGTLSRRTDGRQAVQDIPNAAYGEQQTFRDQQQGADVAQSNPVGDSAAAAVAPIERIPLNADTRMPDVPVTDGAPLGPGAGIEALGLMDPNRIAQEEDLRKVMQYMPVLEFLASHPDSSPSMRQLVRRLKGLL